MVLLLKADFMGIVGMVALDFISMAWAAPAHLRNALIHKMLDSVSSVLL
mgnify:CR=1 FL=1